VTTDATPELPDEPSASRQPGHWLLARLGKRVLRPGGIELTRTLLDRLGVGAADRVVELGPGVGRTAELLLARRPRRYTAVDPDQHARRALSGILTAHQRAEFVSAHAWATGLPDRHATVVIGEAVLGMQSDDHKRAIVAEAFRLCAPGGRYGVHELALVPDDLPREQQSRITHDLAVGLKDGARPVTVATWTELLEGAGFEVLDVAHAPMRLLEPSRLVHDEGFGGALRFVGRVARDRDARRRLLAMRAAFRRHADHLSAVAIVAARPAAPA
jgi:SAM-dependent methyltransferase